MKMKTHDIAEDILLNATDYIGNDLTKFCADNYALSTMRNNQNFRNAVLSEISGCPEDYVHLVDSQEESAKFVWNMYKKWAYGS